MSEGSVPKKATIDLDTVYNSINKSVDNLEDRSNDLLSECTAMSYARDDLEKLIATAEKEIVKINKVLAIYER